MARKLLSNIGEIDMYRSHSTSLPKHEKKLVKYYNLLLNFMPAQSE